MPEPLETLAERLRWCRKHAGITTREIAGFAREKVELSDAYPSAIENGGITNPSVQRLKALCDVLDVQFDWMMWGRGRQPTEQALRRRGAFLKQDCA